MCHAIFLPYCARVLKASFTQVKETVYGKTAEKVTGKSPVHQITSHIYDSFSDVGEIRVYFASKILTPCRMH